MNAQSTHAANAEEDRLVVLSCVLAGRAALELLDQVAPERARLLQDEAARLLQCERRERLAAFTRRFAPAPALQSVRGLARQLDGEPTWYAAAVCQRVAPEIRDRLVTIPSIRGAWRGGSTLHPVLTNLAFRFAARALNG